MNRKYRKPYRIKKRNSIFRSRFFWFVILFLIIFGGIFYWIFLSSFFQVKEIEINGNQKVLTQDLKNVIEAQVVNNLIFIPHKSIILIDLDKIKKAVLEKFTQIEKISLKRNFPHTLIVEVEERKAVAVFCLNTYCFLLDKEGVIFEEFSEDFLDRENPNFIKNNNTTYPQLLKIKNLLVDKKVMLGEKVIDKETLSLILKIEAVIRENLKILISEAFLISYDRVNVKTVESWEIYFNLKEDIDWQLTKLSLILEKEIPLEKRKNLEYIDLRFNKVYYKYR